MVMRRFLWALPAVALLAATASLAQDQNNRPDDRNARQGSGREQNRPGSDRQPGPGGGPDRGSQPSAGPQQRPAPGAGPPVRRPPSAGRPRPPSASPRLPHRFMSGGRWRPSIRGPAFRYPPGFAYRRWGTGLILPPIFLSAPYYYEDYPALGVAPPPAGYRWVRYGPDLLLVSVVTGRIADVVTDVFY
jgi:Ni/Co efflux regulator RcnB